MQNEKKLMKGRISPFKAALSVFCAIILLASGISAGVSSFEIKKDRDIDFRSDITQGVEDKGNPLYQPDITQNKGEGYVGNTGDTPDLPGYLIGTTPISYTPPGHEPPYYYIGGVINSANGNLYLSEGDISINGLGFPIGIVRSYNSHNSEYTTGFGYGWTFNYNIYLIDNSDYVILVDGDSSFYNFTSMGGGIYDAPPGVHSRLNKNGDTFTLRFKDGGRYDFNSDGILQTITDKNGNHLSFSYSDEKLMSVFDDSGVYLNFYYNAEYLVKEIEDTRGRTIDFNYDGQGNLIEVTDPMGGSMLYFYGDHPEDHHLVGFADEIGRVVTFEYVIGDDGLPWAVGIGNSVYDYALEDYPLPYTVYNVMYDGGVVDVRRRSVEIQIQVNSNGNPITITYPESDCSITYVWDEDMNIAEVTDLNGNSWNYEYDSYGNVVSSTCPLGYSTTYEWEMINDPDKYMALIKNITDARLHTWRYQYDEDGNLIQTTDPTSGSSFYFYDEHGYVNRTIDPRGYETNFLYDSHGYLMAVEDALGNTTAYSYDGVGRMIDVTDRDGHTTEYEYDDNDRVINITDATGNYTNLYYDAIGSLIQVKDANSHWINYTRNFIDEPETVTDDLGNEVQYKYDKVGNMIKATDQNKNETKYYYDSLERPIRTVDSDGYEESYSYDNNGNLLSYIDRNWYTTDYEYDGLNRLIRVTDAAGNSEDYDYDGVGNLINFTDGNGFTTKYEYDGLNRLIHVTDAAGNSEDYDYDEAGNLINFTDKNEHTTDYEYDGLNRLIKITDALGDYTRYRYDPVGNLINLTDRNGYTTDYEYDGLNRLIKITDAYGYYKTYTYDPVGNLKSFTDRNDHTTSYTYDSLNRLIKTTDPFGYYEIYSYDLVGNLINITDRNEYTTNYEYDSLNRLIKITDPYEFYETYTYDSVGSLISITNRNGYTTDYEYDALNRLIKITDPYDFYETYSYDPVGNLINFTDKNSHTTDYEYDGLNRLVRVTDTLSSSEDYDYDGVGNLINFTDRNGFTTKYEYDPLNRLVTMTSPMGYDTGFHYDSVGNLVDIIDANGYSTDYEYDPLNRLITITDAMSYETNYTYDPVGNLVEIEDANQVTTGYEYDGLNRLITITLRGHSTEYEYDPCGNRINRTDANGETTQYEYDGLNRLITTMYPDGLGIQYQYDPMGNILQIDNYGGAQETTYYEYDALGRIISEDVDDGMYLINTDYAYDPVGNLISMNYPYYGPGSPVTYEYDELNRLQDITDIWGEITSYTYDDAGRRTRVEYPNGVYTEYAYNENNWLNGLWTNTSTEDPIAYYEYTYDPVGNKISEDSLDASMDFDYDPIYRLITVDTTYPDMSTELVEYTYDPVGNRLTKTIDGGSSTPYTYENNLLVSEGEGLATITYEYDNNGNLIERTPGLIAPTTYEYDYENRLTDIIIPTNPITTISYTYAAHGNHLSKDNGTTTTYYAYSFEDMIQTYDYTGLPDVSFIHGPGIDEPLSMQIFDTSDKYYYHSDDLGSITELTDPSEIVAASYIYEPFGGIRNETGILPNPYRYTGRIFDEETGLYYYRLRYYNSGIGRFISQDPLGMAAGENIYSYVENDPVNCVDPFGLGKKRGSFVVASKVKDFVKSKKCMAAGVLLDTLLENAGMPSDRYRMALQRGYPPREYVVQYRETDFNFVSRLMEEEGIFYYFGGGGGAGGSIVLGRRPFEVGGEYGEYQTSCYYSGFGPGSDPFDNPIYTQYFEPGSEPFDNPIPYDMFFPGSQPFEDNYPQFMSTGFCSAGRTYRSGGSSREFEIDFGPGSEPFDNPIPDDMCIPGSDRDELHGGDGDDLFIGSKHLDRIFGESGDDTWIMEVLPVWDLERHTGGGSTWIRVSHGTAGGQYGMMFIPRIGQEVIVDYLEGDQDKPRITPFINIRPNDLRGLRPGRGYWTKVSQSSNLRYPHSGYVPGIWSLSERRRLDAGHSMGYSYYFGTGDILRDCSLTPLVGGLYFLPWNDTGVGEPSNIHDGDYRALGEDNLSVTVSNNGDYTTNVNVDFTLERMGSTQVEIVNESFEGLFPPSGWQVHHDGNQYPWQHDTLIGHNSPSSVGVYTIWPPTPPMIFDEWLVTDSYDFSEVTSPMLSFWYYGNAYMGLYMSNLEIWASTDGGTTPVDFLDTGINLETIKPTPAMTWFPENVDLSSLEGEEDVHLAFRFVGEESDFIEFFIDDILIEAEEYDWEFLDPETETNGPYDLDPDVWIESFFDVVYDQEGEYRATFSLDTPLRGDWSDDDPENDVYQAVFTVIDDTNPPSISNVQATPSTQEAGGYVNITCDVTDNAIVDTVKVNITGPTGFIPVNVSMNKGSYYYNATYIITGTYYYFIWANDTGGNGNMSDIYQFEIIDTTPPEITDVMATPDTQLVGGYVNITATVTDIIGVDRVKVNITYPDSSTVNVTMSEGSYYYNENYTIVGTYNFSIWANDTSGNENTSDVYHFEITPLSDTIPPEITDVTLTTSYPLDTEIGWENFTCTVTDNNAVDEVKLVLTGDTTTEYPMTNDGDNYYLNITISTADQYTYHIWANDTSDNEITSAPQPFDLPPNWDVDMNGQTYFDDLIAIVMMYGDTGPGYPSPSSFGWVREDVDNNGQAYFDDLIAVVMHYGEYW